jgi:6-phospho-beta-glucosidase
MDLRFPRGFIWGAATAALQIEGATNAGGRGLSVWDVFCRDHPERIWQQASPSIACDHFHRWAEDVRLMKELGHSGYRMSIAWPRVIPAGTGAVHEEGVLFYRRLFEALLEAGIQPNVTLYHWDLPNSLAQQGGWENPETIEAFVGFAEICFRRFGDQVKLWATINEPGWTTLNGYITGLHPPCKQDGAAAVQAGTNLLIAHARVHRLFHDLGMDGGVGLALNMSPVYPASDDSADVSAAALADDLLNGWFSEPLLLGRFPESAWNLYESSDMLPIIAPDDLALLEQAPLDWVGVNYYYPHHAAADAAETRFHLNTSGDRQEECLFSVEGLFRFIRNPAGKYTDWGWEIDPTGLGDVLRRVQTMRPSLPIYVTENGIGRQEEVVDGTVDDQERIEFVRAHLVEVHAAIQRGADVRGYYMWSLLDNFSWLNGFKKRYGFLFVDRQTLRRTVKKSGWWFREVARQNGFSHPG